MVGQTQHQNEEPCAGTAPGKPLKGKQRRHHGGSSAASTSAGLDSVPDLELPSPALGCLVGGPVKFKTKGRKNQSSRTKAAASTSPERTEKVPGQAPPSSPMLRASYKSASQKPDAESTRKAMDRRKLDMLSACLLNPVCGGAVRSVMQLAETGDTLHMSFTSSGWAAALGVSHAGLHSLWSMHAANGYCDEGVQDHPFADDEAFKIITWSRMRTFFRRVATGTAAPSTVASESLGGGSSELGPFLPGATRHKWDRCDTLLVRDGTLTFCLVDVSRLQRHTVEINKWVSRELRGPAGTHPATITMSWLPAPGRLCAVAGGIVAARPPDVLGAKAPTAFQWLQLPKFDPDHPKGERAEAEQLEEARVPESPVLKRTASPLLGPASTPQLRKGGLGSSSTRSLPPASPALGPRVAEKKAKPPSVHSSSKLQRVTVPVDKVVGAISKATTFEYPSSLCVDGVWPLPGNRLLLSVKTVNHAQSDAPCWLQVWEIMCPENTTIVAPVHSTKLTSPVTAVDIARHHDLLVCGTASGCTELRSLTDRGLSEIPCSPVLDVLRSWPSSSSTHGPVREVVLRLEPHGVDGGAVVVSHANAVVAHTTGKDRETCVALPAEAWEKHPCIAATRSVGTGGFAVCTNRYVYAFKLVGPLASLTAVVGLPEEAAMDPAGVHHFEATPYEFMLVLAETACPHRDLNSWCCLWPPASATWAAAQVDASYLQDDEETSDIHRRQRTKLRALQWRAWTLHEETAEVCCVALCLNNVLPTTEQGSSHIHALCLQFGGGAKTLLATASLGALSVVHWGVEVSVHVEELRLKHQGKLAREEREREIEHLHWRLKKAREQLSKVEKLEERVQQSEAGVEVLTEDERIKLVKRAQFELDISRLEHELGLDLEEESEESEEEEDPEALAFERRRQKQAQQAAFRKTHRNQQTEQRKIQRTRVIALCHGAEDE